MSVTLNASTSSGLVQTADTSGTIELQSNGTTRLTVASTGAYGQLVSGTAVASTSGTSIDFTGIPSWVKRITVNFAGVSTNGSADILIQLGTSSGVTTSGYLGTSTSSTSGGTSPSSYTAGIGLRAGGSSGGAATRNGCISINLISSNTWAAFGVVGLSNEAQTVYTGSSIALAATLDRVRITTSNGTDTFDAGTINILYEG